MHTRCYEEVLAGRGFGLDKNHIAIETVAYICNALDVTSGEIHPFLAKALA